MPQLIVRQIEEKVVRKLKERAGQHGVSMEEEHRRILRDALIETSKKKRSFKDCLLSMPNVGEDKDFERGPQIDRSVKKLGTGGGAAYSGRDVLPTRSLLVPFERCAVYRDGARFLGADRFQSRYPSDFCRPLLRLPWTR